MIEDPKGYCWTCDKEGVGLREFYFERLVALKRLELRGEFNLLTLNQDLKNLMGEMRVLVMLPYDEAKDKIFFASRTMKDVAFMLRHMNICVECAKRLGLSERMEALLPAAPSPEQLENFMPVMDIINPMLTKLAEKKEKQS